MNIIDNDLLSIQESRILVEEAVRAQKELAKFSQKQLDVIVDRVSEELGKYARELAVTSCEETEYGNVEDKYLKNRFVCEYLPKKLKDMKCVGVISEDLQKKTKDIGVPLGVIAAFPPATSPVSTTIYKVLLAIKSGNAIIISPHPRAKNVTMRVAELIRSTARKHGIPEGSISYLHTTSFEGAKALMEHKLVDLIMITGVPDLKEAAYRCGKPVLYSGAGNGPVFIERTADIEKAVRDIITSKTFDNGVVMAAEQAIVVDGCIESLTVKELKRQGAYFMNDEERTKLLKILTLENGLKNPEIVGKTAKVLAKMAGFFVPEYTKLLIVRNGYVSQEKVFNQTLLCPIISFYVEKNWREACEKCIELLLGEKRGHTLTIHSKDEEVIEQFSLKKPVDRILVNTPATLGGMGATTNLFPSMTLLGGVYAYGMNTDNISPLNLIYIRKVSYGVR